MHLGFLCATFSYASSFHSPISQHSPIMKFRPDWQTFYGAYIFLRDVSQKETYDFSVRSLFDMDKDSVSATMSDGIFRALTIVFAYVEPEREESMRYETLYSCCVGHSILCSPVIKFKPIQKDTIATDYWDTCFKSQLQLLLSDIDRYVVKPTLFFKTIA